MIRINDFNFKATLKTAATVCGFLLLAAVMGFGQQTINLTAGPTTIALPDGTTVPMWGYSCGALASGVTATCAALNPAAVTTAATSTAGAVMNGWSPVVITVPIAASPTPTSLTINLTNNLYFQPPTPPGGTAPAPNLVPTSIVIVGQVGGGLGNVALRTNTTSPNHTDAQGCPTWFIADPNTAPGIPCTKNDSGAYPPTQANRVQSMAAEVTAVVSTATATCTAPTSGSVAGCATLTWPMLKPGTYLLESGTHPSIQVPMGLIGVLVVTTAPAGTTLGTAYPTPTGTTIPAVQYNAELPLEFSEIDPVQNKEVNTAVNTAGFSETAVWTAMNVPGACGNLHTCYPPAVNYTPFYYLINGVAFSKNLPRLSLFSATAGVSGTPPTPVTTGITGTILARLVNAGLRMHVPSIVGSLTQGFTGAGVATTAANPVNGFTLIAEDGNVIPNLAVAGATVPAAPRVQTDVFMAAGKVFDVMINAPAATATALPIYDRELSLSANSSDRDAGMLAYISVNNSGLPAAGGSIFAAAKANPDSYPSLVAGQPFTVSDPSKGVIANDINVYGVTLLSLPTGGTLTCPAVNSFQGISNAGICANGTFTYTPLSTNTTAATDTFMYCANNGLNTTTVPATCTTTSTTVTLSKSGLTEDPTAIAQSYTANSATYFKLPSPGLLVGNSDTNNLPLSIVTTTPPTPPTGGILVLDANGGFTLSMPSNATATTTTTFTFPYTVQNSQGAQSTAGTVTVNFLAPSKLQVKVLDAQAYNNCQGLASCIAGLPPFPDYRWIIEEDSTFYVDPNCTQNAPTTAGTGCPTLVGPAGQSTIPLFGVNFHASTMNFVAQGCTGPLSCEGGQTMLDTRPACISANNPVGCSTTSGQHIAAVCDVGNGACRPDTTGNGSTPSLPSSVHLDPSKRYYISVLPGDAANPFPANTTPPNCPANGAEAAAGNTACGHTMSGAPIPAACNILGGANACTASSSFASTTVTVLTLPTPLPTGQLSVMVFEDDFPLNGEQDPGGGSASIAPNEPGLGEFNIVLWDSYGNLGDVTGQNTYDMFNQPLSNSLAGTIDPATGLDACPISTQATQNPTQAGITGMIVTCPKYESDLTTLSPLAGQAVIANLMPEKFNVQAYPGANRIARGEEWLQTNTLDGQHQLDSFIRIGEPGYFQEYGPAGYHVAIGFANPKIINDRLQAVCAGAYGTVGSCNNTVLGQVNVQRLSRQPDERLYPSGSHDALAWTQCWVSLGDPDAEDFMFTKCDANGNFKFTGVPGGNWRLTIGDQWNDQIVDGLSTPANVGSSVKCPGPTSTAGAGGICDMGQIGSQQWQSNLYTRVFINAKKDGIFDPNTDIGIPFMYVMVHYRDGHNANALTTDFNGVAPFNETFPLFNWYVVDPDDSATSIRYKTTGIHSVYDAGGPADGSPYCGTANGARACGTSTAYQFMTNTFEAVPLPGDLSVPGAVYCAKADCTAEAPGFAAGTAKPSFSTASTGRIDPPSAANWFGTEAWSGLTGESNYLDIGKAPYAECNPSLGTNVANNSFCATVKTTAPGSTTPVTTLVGENGGIRGKVVYASTRPFDSAEQMIQQPWEPNVPRVTVNLYQEGFAADGVTPTLTLVDHTQTSSWDDWAQGFYPNSTAGSGGGAGQKPYMNCPGQNTATSTTNGAIPDLFYYALFDQPNFLDAYNAQHSGGTLTQHTLPYNSQFKCYDAMKIWNQLQPAPYDGKYSFPSIVGINPTTGAVTGTNCTICVNDPDSTDKYRYSAAGANGLWSPANGGIPMLPPGKYVVQVIMPPGYEVYKEEDKNLLIGDNYIAPVTQQFAGLGADIFIIPDQASVASMYDPNGNGYNPNNFQDQTTALDLQGGMLSGVPGFPTFQNPVWPCVGEMRVVPDYLSLFPQAQEVGPFAGATRPLCDRKEVTLANQMSVSVQFSLFTSTHIASKYTGVITDDFTSEFDPFAPQFGEKFSPPNQPVATRDYLGNEISRVYSDLFGLYNGLTFSSWEVNPPNITGYSPSMMVQCMNDSGPVPDGKGGWKNDPLYDPAYSDFCYEEPYMPGVTTYLDTPVVPTQAFVGAGYNNPDCSYPDATPAIAEVDSQDGLGPWVSAAGHTLTITALGTQTVVPPTDKCDFSGLDTSVNNFGYAGPSANTAPFDCKTISRHYGFGNTPGTVTIGGQAAHVGGWSDMTITVTVPNNVPNCPIQQQAQYQGTAAQCGQLVITTANTAAAGQPSNAAQSIDSVTVTIGGKPPIHHVGANETIQSWIDQAAPGDLIIVDPTCTSGGAVVACTTAGATKTVANHNEMLIMWKPVRLQGVGAASTIINANTNPAGKLLDPWRRHINCLFGLTLQGVPYGTTPYDPSGTYFCPDTGWTNFTAQGQTATTSSNPQVDRLPLEATVGWDATLNGNLAEQLQEPSLMGAYEGAGITVLAKGLEFHGANPWNDANEAGAFPTVTTMLTGVVPNPGGAPGTAGALLVGDANPLCHTVTYNANGTITQTSTTNPYPSNFICNPSSIDGLTVTNSSQGGGGIFVHGWAHYLQIANNRVYNNAGTLSGAISIGQGEFAPPYILGSATNAAPGSCSDGTGLVTNQHEPSCFQVQVGVHNNMITNNSSIGDELFSATLSGGGGVSFCTGNDYYKFNYNWVCGNLSSGEGGGLVHLGEIYNGDIEHNSFVFNQSSNPTIPTNGGGIMIQGTPDTDPVCPGVPDTDCPPGLSDGTGPGLVINANLIQGNFAESGSGGGIRLNQVNGTEVGTFASQPNLWHSVSITNNIIVNNEAGWDGAGISLQDALNVNIINNTIMSNDSLASSGVLTQSIGTPQASAPAGNCVNAAGTASCPQSAGVTSTPNSSLLTTAFTGLTVTCPAGHSNCTKFSNPILFGDIIYQNRSFYIGVGPMGTGTLNQQKVVDLYDAFTNTLAPTQTTTGSCSGFNTGSYWDLGVRGDKTTSPNSGSGSALNPVYTFLANSGYGGAGLHNSTSNPAVITQYCNGSRVPPECTVADGCGGPHGFGVPPGIADSLTPNPIFSLVPSATVDEGNNWINVSWGPLSLTNPSLTGGTYGNYGGGAPLGNYSIQSTSPAINFIPCASVTAAGNCVTPATGGLPSLTLPRTDFFGSPRPDANHPSRVDAGAVELSNH